MAYLQNNSAFIPNGLTRYLHIRTNVMKLTAHWPNDLEMPKVVHNVPIYYDQRPVRFADRTICGGVYRSVSLNDELPNLPPNSYGTLAKRKREKVYLTQPWLKWVESKFSQVSKFVIWVESELSWSRKVKCWVEPELNRLDCHMQGRHWRRITMVRTPILLKITEDDPLGP